MRILAESLEFQISNWEHNNALRKPVFALVGFGCPGIIAGRMPRLRMKCSSGGTSMAY